MDIFSLLTSLQYQEQIENVSDVNSAVGIWIPENDPMDDNEALPENSTEGVVKIDLEKQYPRPEGSPATIDRLIPVSDFSSATCSTWPAPHTEVHLEWLNTPSMPGTVSSTSSDMLITPKTMPSTSSVFTTIDGTICTSYYGTLTPNSSSRSMSKSSSATSTIYGTTPIASTAMDTSYKSSPSTSFAMPRTICDSKSSSYNTKPTSTSGSATFSMTNTTNGAMPLTSGATRNTSRPNIKPTIYEITSTTLPTTYRKKATLSKSMPVTYDTLSNNFGRMPNIPVTMTTVSGTMPTNSGTMPITNTLSMTMRAPTTSTMPTYTPSFTTAVASVPVPTTSKTSQSGRVSVPTKRKNTSTDQPAEKRARDMLSFNTFEESYLDRLSRLISELYYVGPTFDYMDELLSLNSLLQDLSIF